MIDYSATEVHERIRRSGRVVVVRALGPLTALAGLAWALVQPYRITLFEPAKHGVWALLAEGPLLVLVVGLVFHFLIAPGLVADLEEEL